MNHETKHKSGFGDRLLGTVLLVGAAYCVNVCFENSDAFFNVLASTFQITKQEFILLPVGIVLFYAFYLQMKMHLFTPFMKLMDEREEATVGTQNRAKEIQEAATTIDAQFNHCMQSARIDALKVKNQKILAVKEQASEIVKKAQDEANEDISKRRYEIAIDKKDLELQLQSNSKELTQEVVNQLSI